MAADFIAKRDGSDFGRHLLPPGMKNETTSEPMTPGVNARIFSSYGVMYD